jgi:tetratricopeptide (TPR) repeat protein
MILTRAKIDIYICAALGLFLSGCEPQAIREEKALSRQLARELQNHSYESAVPIARELLRRRPQEKRFWRRLVQAQMGLHDYEGARETLTRWGTAVQPGPAKIDEMEGDIAREEHDPARALQMWQQAAASDPKHRRVFEKIAKLQQQQGRWNEAIEAWTNSLKVKDNARGRLHRAICYRRLRNWDAALSDLHHAQKLAPNDAQVRRWSRLFENIGKYLDQLRELDAKLIALPGDVGLLGDSALLFLRCRDRHLALEQAETATRLAPWAMRPRLFQALALIGLGRTKECDRLSIKQPLRLESLRPEFLETLARLDSAISVEPKNADHYITRAWQLNEIAQPLLALQDAQKATELDPKSAAALVELSYALTKLNRADEALAKIKTATELDSTLAPAWEYRGELEMAGGNNLAAIDSLSRALAIRQTATALEKREECYRRVGLLTRADEDHRTLQKLMVGSN